MPSPTGPAFDTLPNRMAGMRSITLPLRRPHGLRKGAKVNQPFCDVTGVMHQFVGVATVMSVRRAPKPRAHADDITFNW